LEGAGGREHGEPRTFIVSYENADVTVVAFTIFNSPSSAKGRGHGRRWTGGDGAGSS